MIAPQCCWLRGPSSVVVPRRRWGRGRRGRPPGPDGAGRAAYSNRPPPPPPPAVPEAGPVVGTAPAHPRPPGRRSRTVTRLPLVFLVALLLAGPALGQSSGNLL